MNISAICPSCEQSTNVPAFPSSGGVLYSLGWRSEYWVKCQHCDHVFRVILYCAAGDDTVHADTIKDVASDDIEWSAELRTVTD